MAKKWDGDTTSSEKLLLLFATLLFNKRSFSLGELSSPSCLNASKATTLRLLRQLENSKIGMLLREKRGRESYYRLEHSQTSGLSINPDGVAQLALCRDLVFHLLPENMREETAQILARLGGRSETAQSLTAVSLVKGQIDYAPFQGIFTALERAIRKRLVCRVAYLAAGRNEAREYLFAPLRLLASQESLYIEGWLLEDDNPGKRKYSDPLRLALQRFQSCELTEFTSEKLPQLPQAQNNLLGMLEYEPFTATVWFAPEAAQYVAERRWSKDQRLERKEDGSVVLTVWMANFHEALAWVLSFGQKAVVRDPDWFAREVRRELREASRNYRKPRQEKAPNDDAGEK